MCRWRMLRKHHEWEALLLHSNHHERERERGDGRLTRWNWRRNERDSTEEEEHWSRPAHQIGRSERWMCWNEIPQPTQQLHHTPVAVPHDAIVNCSTWLRLQRSILMSNNMYMCLTVSHCRGWWLLSNPNPLYSKQWMQVNKLSTTILTVLWTNG